MLNWMSGKRTDEIVSNRASSLCGYLWKMKSTKQKNILIPQWNKRWFSIEGRQLKWYANASSEEASGMVDLRFITDISAFEGQGVFSFILSYPDRNLLLRATNMSDMAKWIRALEYQADIVRGGCGMTIISENNTSCASPQGKGRNIKEKYRPPTLEANLEATMLRLERLEGDLKGPSQSARRMQENKRDSNQNIRDRKYSHDFNIENHNRFRNDSNDSNRENRYNERENESNNDYLRPEDVSLYDKRERIGTMNSKGSSPNNRKAAEEKFEEDTDIDVVSGHGRNQSSPKQHNHKHGNRNDDRNNNGHDRNGYDRNNFRKKNYIHDDEGDDNFRENKNRSRPGPLPGTGYHDEQQRSSSSSSSQGRGPDNNRDHYGDDSVEEISMLRRKNQRIRSQVQGHRDRDRDDRDKNSKANVPFRQSSWGYDDDIYGTKRERSFESNISSRENQALHIAAGKAAGRGSVGNDSGGSGTNSYRSYRSVDHDDGPHVNDIQDMDLTVWKVPQRGARERRQQRESRSGTVDSSQDGPSALGIGEMHRNSGNGWV